jgi:O-antigen/teichoic acid export membrane protein
MVAMSLSCLFSPVFYSFFPIFTQLVSIDDRDALIKLYHKSCQFMSVLVLPAAIVIALFSYEIIFLWTQNPTTAERVHLLVSILICGTALNGIMHLPYALQLAFGWTKLSILKNIIAVIILVPLIIVMAMFYGAVGAASVWLLLNIGYILLEIPIMHRRILSKEKWRWYWQDILVPLIAGLFLAGLGRVFSNSTTSQIMMLLYLLIISLLTLLITIISVPTMRSKLYGQLMKMKFQF